MVWYGIVRYCMACMYVTFYIILIICKICAVLQYWTSCSLLGCTQPRHGSMIYAAVVTVVVYIYSVLPAITPTNSIMTVTDLRSVCTNDIKELNFEI